MAKSITNVAYSDNDLSGYVRAISDNDLFIWVIDLLVHKKYRGNAIGKQLLESVVKEFPNLDVFVLSDVDDYYKQLGYKEEGTVFKIN